ncbi:MAG: DegT/DnrJ/EryC1/StrS family aminotransferase [Deltaproteobacteria bacterium]|nr:DegT/DnrJ/EryC1/StrS family aminotransferase [Deltaproteobacteria bacterium]
MIPIIVPVFGPEETAAVAEVMRTGWVVQGPKVKQFETALAALVGADQAIAVSSATAGLHLALHVAGIGPGDDVVVPSLSFIATTNAAWMAGTNPVFADVAPDCPNVTAETIARAWTDRTRAVIAVHQLGMPLDRAPIAELCKARGAVLIDDAACALGSLCAGEPVGKGAELAVFSFHPRKVVTTGEGGAITTTRADWAERLRGLRQHGMSIAPAERHHSGASESYAEPGWNYRMTDLQAAVGVEQLKRLPAIVERRRALAAHYDALLQDCWDVAPMQPRAGAAWNAQTYCLCVMPDGGPPGSRRDRVLRHLNARDVGARRGILAAHLEPAWRNQPHGPLPCSDAWAAQSLALPLHHYLTDEEQRFVVATLREALAQVA